MRRLGRLAIALVAALIVAVPVLSGVPARAAGDAIDSYSLDYVVTTDGSVDVTEKLVYRFGPDSGRHGIQRVLVTREPEKDDTEHDIVYDYKNISVSSPDAPDDVSIDTYAVGDRGEAMRIRVGDPDTTIGSPTATYELRYTITGAMRTSGDYDEFYWDTTGFDWDATISDVAVSVTVPEGATDARCYAGEPTSTTECDAVGVDDGVVRARQNALGEGESVTISAQIRPGLISDNTPNLVPARAIEQRRRAITTGILGAVSAIASTAVGAWIIRSRRDQRFLDLPPGVLPAAGQQARVGRSPRDITVPVAFTPPQIPVAEAGFLLDGRLDPRETAATIIALAVSGAVRISGDGRRSFTVTLVDPDRARAPHETVLLSHMFNGRPPGATVDLGTPGRLTAANDAMAAMIRRQVQQRGWFTRVPGGGLGQLKLGRGWMQIFLVGAIGVSLFGAVGSAVLVPLIPVVLAGLVVSHLLRRGQRTAEGRAVTDQIEGFREYLATAEADQIRFEEGQDIYSAYLPWAIAFDLADRWARICQDLVEAGRIPEVHPDWYVGHFYLQQMSFARFADTVGQTIAPPVSTGAGTGFGSGGSAFGGGGGFSGGGGGGGGGGSW